MRIRSAARLLDEELMGIDLLLNVIALAHDRKPNWVEAERRVAELEFEDLDRFFGYWDPDGDLKQEAAANESYLEQLRVETLEQLADLRHAVDNYRRDMIRFDFQGLRFFVTGGLSAGEVPTELYDSFSSLCTLGVVDAAGFIVVSVAGVDEDAGSGDATDTMGPG
jgi:hypothetical protein